ncbi:MAG: uroporphyrinogen decarboxylase family protein [Planctomycetota bacterium]|jgi:uroporphyrinogen decarboxylase
MTPREIVAAQINHEDTPVVPYSFSCEQVVADALTEHYGSEEAWRDQLVTYMDHAGGQDTSAREDYDDIRHVDAFGTIWRMDKRPFHLETPGLPEPTFDGYEFPRAEVFIENSKESKENALKKLTEDPQAYQLVYMGWGLFEQSWGVRGFENFLEDVVLNQDFVEELLDRLTDLFLTWVDFWADVPADGIMFGDDWGMQQGVIIGPDLWRKFFKPRWAKIYQRTRETGKTVITHCCGSIADIMDDVVEIGLDVLESVQPEATGMNPYELKKRYGKDLAFWGCLGSQSTLQFGSPDDIQAEVRKLRKEMSKGGGFILAPAKELQPGTPPENAIAAFEAFVEDQS